MKIFKKIIILLLTTFISLSLLGCETIQTVTDSPSYESSSSSSINTTEENKTSSSTNSSFGTITLVSETESIISYYASHDFNVNELVEGDLSVLKQAIFTILNDANICITYKDSRDHFKGTDKDPDNSSNFLLIYSGVSVTGWDSSYMSREHIWPQSLGHSKDQPGGHDLYNLRPEHRDVNSTRGNKVYGNVSSNKTTLYYPGNKNIICGWYNSSTFEPPDDVKGDIARICFYYSIKYNFDLSIIVSDDTYTEILEWNLIDPVSEIEINRNNYIQTIQGNRNIFVDYPELADYIWGNK